jgi:predicted HNH restriction endonuclease
LKKKKAYKVFKEFVENKPPKIYKTSEQERARKTRNRNKNPEYYREYQRRHYEANKQAYIDRAAARKEVYRAQWTAFKATLACTKCGENHPSTLDFHHVVRSPENKKVHRLIANMAFKKAMEELKKCIVLCSNCHRKLHWEEYQKKTPQEDPGG